MREYLKQLRNRNNLTQRQVADKLGISQNYYSCIENGLKQKSIDLWLIVGIADLYKVDVNYLIGEEAKLRNQKGA